jgi:ketosteroid isomerase-like protein
MNAAQESTTTGADAAERADVPAIVAAHQAAHEAHDVERELACFAEHATVTDEGRTYQGLAEIRTWMGRAASEYTYTSELTALRQDDAEHWTVVRHLEGDFPGGVVDLRYRYTLGGDRITNLTIAP